MSERERLDNSRQERWTFAVFSVLACVMALFLLGSTILGLPHNCGVDAGFGFTLPALLAGTLISYGMAPALTLLIMGAIGYHWTRRALKIELFAIALLLACAAVYSIVPHPNAQTELCGFKI